MFGFAREETIIQVNAEGPWAINYINPADDPRNIILRPFSRLEPLSTILPALEDAVPMVRVWGELKG